jgi:hypothetical protein
LIENELTKGYFMEENLSMAIDSSEGGHKWNESDGCRILWCMKLMTHLDDITFGTVKRGPWPKHIKRGWKPRGERLYDARKAKAYFEGLESDNFDMACLAAGIDPDVFFDRVKKAVRKIESVTGYKLHELLDGVRQ